MAKMRCWLLLEKLDANRISKGIDGYRDRTGESYNYDSLVPNHTKISPGDLVVLRLDNEIVGIGRIGSISKRNDVKRHRRCPKCNSTDIRERSTLAPPYKCGKCSFEFSKPLQTSAAITAFVAAIADFSRFDSSPRVSDVKTCATSGGGISSQLSILELDVGKLRTVLEGTQIQEHAQQSTYTGQGMGLSAPERKAVEIRAMLVVKKMYEINGWKVIDTSSSKSYDFLATKGEAKRFIEVKGTTGFGTAVILTRLEVEHARANPNEHCLVVVSGIMLKRESDEWSASGGAVTTHLDPWTIESQQLYPTQYRYTI